jgi:hypothetical protein
MKSRFLPAVRPRGPRDEPIVVGNQRADKRPGKGRARAGLMQVRPCEAITPSMCASTVGKSYGLEPTPVDHCAVAVLRRARSDSRSGERTLVRASREGIGWFVERRVGGPAQRVVGAAGSHSPCELRLTTAADH